MTEQQTETPLIIAARKDGLLAQMREAGLLYAEADYSGEWDDGAISWVKLFPREAGPDEYLSPVTHADLQSAVEEFAWDLLDEEYGVWYDSCAGAEGTVSINAETGVVRIDHGVRVVEYETKEF